MRGMALQLLTVLLSLVITGCATGIYTHKEINEDGKLVVTAQELYLLFGTFTADTDKVKIEPIGANIIPDNIISIAIGAGQKK